MNLNPNYNYLIIDTETTGLSIEDDQIIQVALITIDHQWNITNRYTHYVKPADFGDDQLKPLIQHITGIDPTQIMSAPPLSTIWWQIEQYWDDRTVVIWHNISFDLAMLGKHHKLEYADTIDTFDCAKTLVHYQRSYSLEILHQQLLLQPRYQAYLKGITIKPHDALSDCYMTYGLLRYCMERAGDMTDEYPWLGNILEDGQWSQYLGTAKGNKRQQKTIKELLKIITREDFEFEPYNGAETLRKYRSKGAIIDHNNNVLLMKSSEANNWNIIYYELPWWKLEQGEIPEQWLKREVLEETWYHIKDISPLWDIVIKHNDVLWYTMHGFLAYTNGSSTEQSLTDTEIEKWYELVTMSLDDAMMAIQKYLTNINQDLRKWPYLANAAHLILLQEAKKLIQGTKVWDGKKIWSFILPTLKAPLATPKTMVDHEYYDWTGLASTSKIWLEDAGFAASLLKLVHPSRKMIIAFAHRAKLDLAKKILADHGITGIGYMRANQYIDPTQLSKLGSQGQRDHDEVSRILKYCSHHMQWLSVLDHNTPWDFKVYQRVRLIRDDGDADIILSTHAWVYAALQEWTHSDHAILFWDHQWWLSSAQRFYQSGVRIDHVINMIEWIIYKLKHQDTNIDSTKLDELQNRREITRWIFGSELLAYRSQLPTNNKWNIECLWGLPREHMTNFTLLYTQKDQYFSIISDFLALDHSVSITRILDRLDMLLHDGCQIDIQSNYQWDNITISPANTYVDYADFRALFAWRHVIFANTSGQWTDNITTPLQTHPPTIQLSHLRELDYQVGQKLYIIQSNRNQCRATFDTLMKQWLNKQTLLMGENVTGWGNKLIEQARGASSYVMVWGYDLYMQTLAAGLVCDAVMTVGTLWALHDQMIRDVEFYAS